MMMMMAIMMIKRADDDDDKVCGPHMGCRGGLSHSNPWLELRSWPVQERSASPACADLPSRRDQFGGSLSFARGLLTNLLLL